ncbi:hypothetical protein PCC7424_1086 [Gloeothece citriformis PCC 7424]|uniref:Uncharacterized protein n=1 Tax=Gloeothece citriformis (strain PCC 7424) TaxID=65393 RepID=B7KJU0_GLOC7|nr:hypothetical protein [Gloeothece citriformis]ACK69539.1 hypothetical protein PCC7424_1086 [Gloeothece citriformis PCC 7424]
MKKVIINHRVIRNYVIMVASVITLSAFIGDLFHSQSRIAQQDRLNGYAPFIGAGVVNYGKDFLEPSD